MRPLIGLTLVVCLSSCSTGDSLDEATRSAVAAEVRTMLLAYDADVKAGGLMAEFAYLDSSADFFWVPPGYSSPLSFDSVTTIIKSNATNLKVVDNSWDSVRVIPLSSSAAMYTGTISSLMIDTSGKETRMRLIETGFAIKRGGKWKMLSGQTAVLQ